MLTALDQIANQNHLQMIKAAVPYLSTQEQKFIAVYAKLLELQNIMNFYSGSESSIVSCSMEQEPASITDILSDIRNYCDPSEQEMIDRCLQMITALELYSTMSQPIDGTY
ncbi:MAG: hypothetical protein Q4C59_04125 [Lachnospiraceae bacterium]|nr:hypothetical protein [Lachnospiraceae bacterium]